MPCEPQLKLVKASFVRAVRGQCFRAQKKGFTPDRHSEVPRKDETTSIVAHPCYPRTTLRKSMQTLAAALLGDNATPRGLLIVFCTMRAYGRVWPRQAAASSTYAWAVRLPLPDTGSHVARISEMPVRKRRQGTTRSTDRALLFANLGARRAVRGPPISAVGRG